MARRSGGLSIIQVITLTFGFLVASVLIFICGWWVGYDMAEQRLAAEQKIISLPAAVAPTPGPTNTVVAKPVVSAAPSDSAPAVPTRGAAAPATPAGHQPLITASAVPPKTATPTRTVPAATATARPTKTDAPTRAPTAEAAPAAASDDTAVSRTWSVQAVATTDNVQALVHQRKLRDRGYPVVIVTSEIGGSTWYQLRVGRYKERDEAEHVAEKLRSEEGLAAAFVTSQ